MDGVSLEVKEGRESHEIKAYYCDCGDVCTWNGADGQRSLHSGQSPAIISGRVMNYKQPTQAHCV